jgi:hypothetical protein
MSTFMRATASLVFGILYLFACQSAIGQTKGGPGGKTQPPVRYQLQLVPFPVPQTSGHGGYADGANNAGEVVGRFSTLDYVDGINYSVSHAFVYSPLLAPTAVDLHVSVQDQINGLLGSEWYLRGLFRINSAGDAVGSLAKYGVKEAEERRACVVYGATTASPQLMLLPDQEVPGAPVWKFTHGVAINDGGMIAVRFITSTGTHGVYVLHPLAPAPFVLRFTRFFNSTVYMNNNNIIATQRETGDVIVYNIETDDSVIYPQLNYNSREQYSLADINDSNVLCGGRIVSSKHQMWRHDGTLFAVNTFDGPPSINSTKDMATARHLYHEGMGLLNLDTLVRGATADVNRWNSSAFRQTAGLSERGDWNGDSEVAQFPGIAGSISGGTSGNWIFLLTPVKP